MNDWPTRMGDFQRTGKADGGPAPPLKLKWKSGLKSKDNYLWNSPIVKDEIVYMTMQTGSKSEPFCLHALNINDGSTLWRNEDVRCSATGSATYHDNGLFVCDFYGILSIDPETGLTLWEYPVDKLIREMSPAIHKNTVIAGSANGFLYALDAKTGKLSWDFEARNRVIFSPSVWNDILYVGTTRVENLKETFFALDARSGEIIWKHEFEGDSSFHYNSTAAIRDGNVIVAVERYGLCAFDAENGELLWLYETKHGPFTAPCVSENIVYVVASDPKAGIHAVEIKSGKRIWASRPGPGLAKSAPVIGGDYIYIGGGHWPAIYSIDRNTGEKVWEYETGDIVFSTPAIADNMLLIGCHDGHLYCFGE